MDLVYPVIAVILIILAILVIDIVVVGVTRNIKADFSK